MPSAEYWWTEEEIIEKLDDLGKKMIVEKPVVRGKNRGITKAARRAQACRLIESGWSAHGLATYYDVPLRTVEAWLQKLPTERIRVVHGVGKRPIWVRICEAVALIQLDLWHQPRRGIERYRYRLHRLSRIERRH